MVERIAAIAVSTAEKAGTTGRETCMFGGFVMGKKATQGKPPGTNNSVSPIKPFTGMALTDLLAFLDDGGLMHPKDLARAIRRIDPDFSPNDTQRGRRGRCLDDEWSLEQKKIQEEREKGTEIVRDAIRKTPVPSATMLDYLGMTSEQYHTKRNELLVEKQKVYK